MAERTYYWLVCQDPDTRKPYLIAGGSTEDEARLKGLEVLSGIDFEIKALPTRNLARASSLLKGDRLERLRNLRKASERLGHDRSLRRMHKRRGRAGLHPSCPICGGKSGTHQDLCPNGR